jgi:hypothetical protein
MVSVMPAVKSMGAWRAFLFVVRGFQLGAQFTLVQNHPCCKRAFNNWWIFNQRLREIPIKVEQ